MNRVTSFFGLLGLVLVFFSEGVNESIIGPIYPLRAMKVHGTSQTMMAFTMAMFTIGQFVASSTLLVLNIKKHIRTLFIFAACISANAIILFGYVDTFNHLIAYNLLSIIMRFIVGFSAGVVWSLAFTMMNNYFDEIGKKISNAFIPFFYFGITVGPQISLFFSQNFTYSTPFYICGVLELIMVIPCLAMAFQKPKDLLHNIDELGGTDDSYFSFFKDIRVVVFLLNRFYASVTYGYFDGVLADFFKNTIELNDEELITAYLLCSIPMMPSSLFFGCYISNKGFSFIVVFISLFLYCLCTILLYLSKYFAFMKNFYIISGIVSLFYIARGSFITAVYPALSIYLSQTFPSKSIVSITMFVSTSGFAFSTSGISFGAIFYIGVLKSFLGIYWSLFGIALSVTISMLAFIYFFIVNTNFQIFKKYTKSL